MGILKNNKQTDSITKRTTYNDTLVKLNEKLYNSRQLKTRQTCINYHML